jgi:hypothetical protein
MTSKRKSSGNGRSKKKVAIRTLKSKKESPTDMETRTVKGGITVRLPRRLP